MLPADGYGSEYLVQNQYYSTLWGTAEALQSFTSIDPLFTQGHRVCRLVWCGQLFSRILIDLLV